MRYPAEETAEKRERILKEAIRLFRERGFANVSVGDVMKAAGLTHGPFYNHFASKEALVAESIARGMREGTDKSLDAVPSSEKGKKAAIKSYLREEHCANPSNGCTASALAGEIAREPAAQRALTEEYRYQVERWVEHFPWKSKRTARADALATMATLLGAVTMARAVDDPELREEILAAAEKSLTSR